MRSASFLKSAVLASGMMIATASVSLAQTVSDDAAVIHNRDETVEMDVSTREQRLQVPPLDWDATRGEGLRTEAPEVLAPSEVRGAAGSSGSGRPSSRADTEAEQAFPEQWEGLESKISIENLDEQSAAPGVLGTADVYTQYCENCGPLHLQWPMRAVGKLFTNAGSCSASVISPNNVIVTAAHCCYDRSRGDWIRGWQFAPAYKDGFAPYGTFNWTQARVVPRWISHGDRRSDVCVIKLGNNNQNRPVTYYTGWFGRSWNWGTTQVHHSLGYPGNIGGGNKQELCVSESFNPSSGCGGTSVLNTGCSMTYGASGGPWVRGYRGGDWVNSVVSGYDGTSCTGTFGQTYNGPRFTSDNIVYLCDRIGC